MNLIKKSFTKRHWGCGAEGAVLWHSAGSGPVLSPVVSARPGERDLVYDFPFGFSAVCGALLLVLPVRAEELQVLWVLILEKSNYSVTFSE